MNKLDIISILREEGTLEKGEHYKHSECFATMSMIVLQADVDCYPVLEPFLGKKLVASGMLDYYNGLEPNGDLEIHTQVTVEVPEQITPAHTFVEWQKEGDL